MKRLNLFLALFVLSLGAFIGFNSKAPSQALMASDQPMIRWVDVPKSSPLELNINLSKDSVSISGNADNASVTITTKEDVKVVPKYILKEVDKPIYIASSLSNKVIVKYCPLEKPIRPKRDQNHSLVTD